MLKAGDGFFGLISDWFQQQSQTCSPLKIFRAGHFVIDIAATAK